MCLKLLMEVPLLTCGNATGSKLILENIETVAWLKTDLALKMDAAVKRTASEKPLMQPMRWWLTETLEPMRVVPRSHLRVGWSHAATYSYTPGT
jgi:hypothetical protein